MNGRISTQMLYSQPVSRMNAGQQRLLHLQKQLDSGHKILTGKDDPVAAAAIVDTQRALAVLQQAGRNADAVLHRLGLQENTLTEAGELLNHVSELILKANDAALSAEDRKSIAIELHSVRDALLALANSRDGNGRFLFAGSDDENPPFTVSQGQVSYHGNAHQRQVDIAPGTQVKDTIPGSDIFLHIRSGDGVVDGWACDSNTGNAVVTAIHREGEHDWKGNQFTVRFAENHTYQIIDSDNHVIESGTWNKGEAIVFHGLHVHLDGEPAEGDRFTIGAAQSNDMFAWLDELEQTLAMDTSTPQTRCQQQNRLQASLRTMSQARTALLDARTQGGTQLNLIERTADLRQANTLTLSESLSVLRDLDPLQAIGEYRLESTALQAAQIVFTQMQSMSLFRLIS